MLKPVTAGLPVPASVRAREADLAEERDARRELRRHVQRELPERESGRPFASLGLGEVDVTEARELQARILTLLGRLACRAPGGVRGA